MNKNLYQTIEIYLKHFAHVGSHTARAKKLDLEHFLAFLLRYKKYQFTTAIKLSDWDYAATQAFVDDSLAKGEAVSTVARRLATVKHMGRTLAEQQPGFINPARGVKSPKLQSERPKGLSLEQSNSLLKSTKLRLDQKPCFARLRDQVLVFVLLETGLRADEVRLLKAKQLSEDYAWFHAVRTKGKRYRNVYIAEDLRPHLKEYMQQRAQQLNALYATNSHASELSHAKLAAHPIFISNYKIKLGQPNTFYLSEKTIWRAVSKLSKDKKLHPHLLRHTFALGLLENSKDIRLVAQALGHSDVRTTMRYTERSDHHLAEAIEKKNKSK